jgi:hypothetical protein
MGILDEDRRDQVGQPVHFPVIGKAADPFEAGSFQGLDIGGHRGVPGLEPVTCQVHRHLRRHLHATEGEAAQYLFRHRMSIGRVDIFFYLISRDQARRPQRTCHRKT